MNEAQLETRMENAVREAVFAVNDEIGKFGLYLPDWAVEDCPDWMPEVGGDSQLCILCGEETAANLCFNEVWIKNEPQWYVYANVHHGTGFRTTPQWPYWQLQHDYVASTNVDEDNILLLRKVRICLDRETCTARRMEKERAMKAQHVAKWMQLKLSLDNGRIIKLGEEGDG